MLQLTRESIIGDSILMTFSSQFSQFVHIIYAATRAKIYYRRLHFDENNPFQVSSVNLYMYLAMMDKCPKTHQNCSQNV